MGEKIGGKVVELGVLNKPPRPGEGKNHPTWYKQGRDYSWKWPDTQAGMHSGWHLVMHTWTD